MLGLDAKMDMFLKAAEAPPLTVEIPKFACGVSIGSGVFNPLVLKLGVFH